MKRLSKVVVFIACVLLSINFFSGTAKAAIYTVNSNDTLYKISQLYQYSVSTLKTDNNLTTDKIYPGQSLYVPAEIYSVKSGDTLYTIAKKYGIKVKTND
jgi:LysM repeat protein